jgi:hypothetical protein
LRTPRRWPTPTRRGASPRTSIRTSTTVPDERYPTFSYNPSAGPVKTLFGSNYADNGTTHLLGFTHRRPAWSGTVVAYQPGEYQPHALDDLSGNNFQILANEILYAADARRRNTLALTVTKGPGPDEVSLAWSAGQPTYTVYRSSDPADVTSRCRRVATTGGLVFSDTPPPASITFYQIAGP